MIVKIIFSGLDGVKYTTKQIIEEYCNAKGYFVNYDEPEIVCTVTLMADKIIRLDGEFISRLNSIQKIHTIMVLK